MGKKIGVFIGAIVGLVVAVACAGGFLAWQFAHSPGSSEDRDVIYEVPPNKGFQSIAKDLELLGAVKNAQAFSLYARFTGERSKIKVGEYALKTSMKPADVLAVITSGKSIARPFTVSEGLNLFEIAQLYERDHFGTAKDFLELARNPEFAKSLVGEDVLSLEGYLFPETYQITKYTTTRELLTAMVARFHLVWKDIVPQIKASPMPVHQVVTLASIIEKETGAAEERPLISSVFHNRLGKGMRLQTDPTIIYGIADETGIVPSNISHADLSRPTKYNTYVISGLPPGPIANPGRLALLAAVAPTASPYLYFVSQNNGTHVFSATYEEHERAVKKFQLDPKAREGKSWRDLSKTPQKSTGVASP